MTKKIIIAGVTGAYGSGKSLVADEFQKLGAYIIDADILAREVVTQGSPALKEIENNFGKEVLLPSGSLDRTKMAELIFNDPSKRKKLEDITHPKIRELFKTKLDAAKKLLGSSGLIMYIVPLLFESNNKYPELEKIIVVSAPPEESIKRIMKRDGSDRQLAEKKYSSQMPIAEKEKRGDYIIKNDSTLEALSDSVKRVFSEITK